MEKSPLQRACDIVGGQAALGRKIGRKQSTIWNWLKKGIPSDDCPAVEAATDGVITRYELRPDVFGDPPTQKVRKRGAKSQLSAAA